MSFLIFLLFFKTVESKLEKLGLDDIHLLSVFNVSQTVKIKRLSQHRPLVVNGKSSYASNKLLQEKWSISLCTFILSSVFISSMSPPAISTVFPINRILYFISRGSILNIRRLVFYTSSKSHAKAYSIGLSLLSLNVFYCSMFFHFIKTHNIIFVSSNHLGQIVGIIWAVLLLILQCVD